MLQHVARALTQFLSVRFLFIAVKAVALTAVFLALLGWFGVWIAGPYVEAWLASDWGSVALGVLVFGASVLLLVPASSIAVSFFAEEASEIVERRYYPNQYGPRDPTLAENVTVGLRLAVKTLFLNVLALPLYLVFLFIPPLSIALFVVLNGYLAGREYFEMVALRHGPAPAARRLRRAHRVRIFCAGMIVAAGLLIPIFNFFAPLFGAALMVHVFQEVRARAVQSGTAAEYGLETG